MGRGERGGEEERRGGRRGSVLSTNVQWLMRNRSPYIYLQYRERESSQPVCGRERKTECERGVSVGARVGIL